VPLHRPRSVANPQCAPWDSADPAGVEDKHPMIAKMAHKRWIRPVCVMEFLLTVNALLVA